MQSGYGWPAKACVEAVVWVTLRESVQELLAAVPEVAQSPEAVAALQIAASLDSVDASRGSGAAMQGEAAMWGRFREAIDALRAMAPERKELSRFDEIRARREAKAAKR